jgi:hypothetical protein
VDVNTQKLVSGIVCTVSAILMLAPPLATSGDWAHIAPSTAKGAQNTYAVLMSRAAQPGGLRLLVTLDTGTPNASGEAAGDKDTRLAAAQATLVAELAGTNAALIKAYAAFPIVLLQVDDLALQHVLTLPGVLEVQEDGLNQIADNGSNGLMQTATAWSAGYDGTGWMVVVLDTGTQEDHLFLGGRVVAEACFSGGSSAAGYSSLCPNGQGSQFGSGAGANCSGSLSGCGHGTHIAGIAAGMGTFFGGPGFDGVARNASLASIQVFSEYDALQIVKAFDSDVLAAMQYVHTDLATNPAFKIAAVNISFAGVGDSATTCDSNAYKTAIDTLRSDGIATIVSAGNDGVVGLSPPACVSSAISVGAVDDSDNVPNFSDRATFMSLFAPGVSVTSSIPTNSYQALTGTSISAAQVSGAWAIMKQQRPAASVATVLNVLQASGVQIATNGFSRPRVDFGKAIDVIFVHGFESPN